MDSERRQVDEYNASQGDVDQSLARAAKTSKKRAGSESETES